MPLVTMVVAAYNRPKPILSLLYSLLVQTWQEFEIIVVHDGVGEVIQEVVTSLDDSRIRFYETDRRYNDFGNSSKELGSLLAAGEYIGHTNDDNYYAPVYFEAMLCAMLQADADFAYCNMVHSHQGYAAFDTHPVPGRIDGGGWICKANVVRATLWPELKSDVYADGRFAESLAVRSNRVVKVPGFLFVHN